MVCLQCGKLGALEEVDVYYVVEWMDGCRILVILICIPPDSMYAFVLLCSLFALGFDNVSETFGKRICHGSAIPGILVSLTADFSVLYG